MPADTLRTLLQGIALGTAHECAQRCPGGFTERDRHSPDCPSGYGEDAREALTLLEALEAEHAAEVAELRHALELVRPNPFVDWEREATQAPEQVSGTLALTAREKWQIARALRKGGVDGT